MGIGQLILSNGQTSSHNSYLGGKGTNYDLVLGSHSFIPGFEEQLVGVKAGEEKELNLTFPENYHAEDLKGAAVVFKVKVNEVKTKVLPEVNDDFAKDVKTIMEGRGVAHMGVGIGTGDNRIEDAVRNAIESPLLETSIDGARSILLYVCGGYDMGMQDISKIASKIQDEADPDANIIFGATVNENMNDKVSITLIATDFTSGGLSAPIGQVQ